ncbi:hypothetical protein Sp245p_28855 (plasmid) [Azospirillum baldaniorum]|uniref:Uncharacterized protein n=1 Tax=Azospirillum baldaniorum TaxID=1064539 RepID=A0A9P1JY05_9PROT|nr:hypothetical protein [Azospirillum baldaniorum]AWJ93832.1 hypothetical protein Sp245p_28855 [Azospirillum baldaniorum]TWA81655.1 hypothetical protein FBZ85_10229 [Azospirillum brasilense]CCD01990.1 protein of unknown function [Azospirillum baldaniorum]
MTNITTEHREALGPLVEFLDDTYADPDFDMPITLNKTGLPMPHSAAIAFLREIAADRPWTMGFRVGSAGEIILVFTPQSGLVADLEAALAQDFDLLSDVVAGTA